MPPADDFIMLSLSFSSGLVGFASLHLRALANSFEAFDICDVEPSRCSFFWIFELLIVARLISSSCSTPDPFDHAGRSPDEIGEWTSR